MLAISSSALSTSLPSLSTRRKGREVRAVPSRSFTVERSSVTSARTMLSTRLFGPLTVMMEGSAFGTV